MTHKCNGVLCTPIRTEEAKTLIEYADGMRTWVKADGVKPVVEAPKFKVGDQVRVNWCDTNSIHHGKIGIIVGRGSFKDWWDIGTNGTPDTFPAERLELPPFEVKVGDTVEWDASKNRADWMGWCLQGRGRVKDTGSGRVLEMNSNKDSAKCEGNDGWRIPVSCVTKVTPAPPPPKFALGANVIQISTGKEMSITVRTIMGREVTYNGRIPEDDLIPIPSMLLEPRQYESADGVLVSRSLNGRWRGVGTSDFSTPEAAVTWSKYQITKKA